MITLWGADISPRSGFPAAKAGRFWFPLSAWHMPDMTGQPTDAARSDLPLVGTSPANQAGAHY